MLIAWNQVAIAALLASLLALVILLVFRIRWRTALKLSQVMGLALCAGIGLTLWFIIFNTFALKVLDFDFPIPLFPVSPEDLSCMAVTGLTAYIYVVASKRLSGFGSGENHLDNSNQASSEQINNSPRLERWVWILPALAALIIDIYFI